MNISTSQRYQENRSSISEPIIRQIEAVRHDIAIWFAKHQSDVELMEQFQDFSNDLLNQEENDYNQYRALRDWYKANISGRE